MFNFLAAWSGSKIATVVFASVFALIFVVCLIVAFLTKNAQVPYDKDGFVHKVLKHDFSVFYQLANFTQILLFIAGVVVYFVKFKYHYIVSASIFGVLVLVSLVILGARIKTKSCRIEYNRNALYKFGLFGTSKEIAWKDLKNVSAKGVGRDRVYVFEGKKNTTIKVPFKMVGAYEFIVFCEKQLDGKNFEVIKMGKARQ